jgi:mannose-6-phosphate isomerase class I
MIAAPYFAVDFFELKEPHVFSTIAPGAGASGKSSVQILTAVEGCGVVEVQGRDPVTLAKGDAVVLPAAVQTFTVRPQWTVEFLKACVPGAALPEPATRL